MPRIPLAKFKIIQVQAGFSLIELSIVLLIVGLLLGSFVGTLSKRIDNTRVSETKKELDSIKRAILGFAYSQGASSAYLPCPDTIVSTDCATCNGDGDCDNGTCVAGDGLEDRNDAGQCVIHAVSNKTGNIPWSELGLGGGDAWGSRFRYWVSPEYSDSVNFFTVTTIGTTADIKEPNFVTQPDGSDPKILADNVVMVIFSHGKNKYGGTSDINNAALPSIPAANTDEGENNDDDEVFIDRVATDENAPIATGEFDDIITWIGGYELKGYLVEAGLLP